MTPEDLIKEFWPDLEQVRIAPLTNIAGDAITAWEVKVLLSGGLIEAFSDASYSETLTLAEVWLRKKRNGEHRFDYRVLKILRGDY